MLALAFLLAQAHDPIARVDGLVLIGTTAGPMFDVARLRIAALGRWEWRIPVTGLLRLWNHPTVTRAASRILDHGANTTPVDFRTLPRQSDLAVGLAGWRNTDWRARRSFRVAMEGFDVREQLGKLNLPAVVLHGTRDVFFPMSVGEELARRLPRGELRPVPGAAHVLPLTHPDAVVRAVRNLLPPPR
jgi:pimeloyl-ACP methyl ester carboxylesterase